MMMWSTLVTSVICDSPSDENARHSRSIPGGPPEDGQARRFARSGDKAGVAVIEMSPNCQEGGFDLVRVRIKWELSPPLPLAVLKAPPPPPRHSPHTLFLCLRPPR